MGQGRTHIQTRNTGISLVTLFADCPDILTTGTEYNQHVDAVRTTTSHVAPVRPQAAPTRPKPRPARNTRY